MKLSELRPVEGIAFTNLKHTVAKECGVSFIIIEFEQVYETDDNYYALVYIDNEEKIYKLCTEFVNKYRQKVHGVVDVTDDFEFWK
jgi:predicted neutral ceramidase superfamily lipid hydrolase